jgi:hypothetical protein
MHVSRMFARALAGSAVVAALVSVVGAGFKW